MRGQSTTTIIGIIVLIILIGAGAWWYFSMPPAPLATNTTQTDAADQQAVSDTVTNFGKELQLVSLTASSTGIAQAVANYYAPFVTPDLLSTWENAPSSTPGRLTSSPWPDHIDISSVTKNDDGTYTVEGDVAEITSDEVTNGGVADTYPITITLSNSNGTWLISNFTKD